MCKAFDFDCLRLDESASLCLDSIRNLVNLTQGDSGFGISAATSAVFRPMPCLISNSSLKVKIVESRCHYTDKKSPRLPDFLGGYQKLFTTYVN